MRDQDADIYDSDPAPAPEGDFEPAELDHLVVGNCGRLLDARRTPIAVSAVDIITGLFEVEILAFEDAGARWRLPFEDVRQFQFARGSGRADAAARDECSAAITRFDRKMTIDCDPGACVRSTRRIAEQQHLMRGELDDAGVAAHLDPSDCIDRRDGDSALATAVRAILAKRMLVDIDDAFAEQYVSNPQSGELVKGHAIVLAELGLRAYRGKVVRNSKLFEGDWSKERRAAHLIARLALTHALRERTGSAEVTLYRAAATERPRTPLAHASFVSATFARRVAESHFAGGPTGRFAVMYRQVIPLQRLFMTFYETPAMNGHFHEAEAVLIRGTESAGF